MESYNLTDIHMFAAVANTLLAGCAGNTLSEWASSGEGVVESRAADFVCTARTPDTDKVTYRIAIRFLSKGM